MLSVAKYHYAYTLNYHTCCNYSRVWLLQYCGRLLLDQDYQLDYMFKRLKLIIVHQF